MHPEEIALLGNAAAVPIIIGITQLLKKNFSFKYKSDVVSFFVSMIICPLWWFYNTPEAQIIDTFDDGFVSTLKFGMWLVLISIATWLAATKSYDLFSGNKKRIEKHTNEKDSLKVKHTLERKMLRSRIKELEDELESGGENEPEEDNEISNRLLDILEGRN